MTRITTLLLASACMLGAAACVPSASYQGFQAIDANPHDVKVGTDTRATVLARLGTPTAKAPFDKDAWFYLTQISDRTAYHRPQVVRRDITEITFDKSTQTVKSVDLFTLKDGRVVGYNKQATPTRGRELTFLEQLFGNLSTIGTLPPPQDYTPGSHPGGP